MYISGLSIGFANECIWKFDWPLFRCKTSLTAGTGEASSAMVNLDFPASPWMDDEHVTEATIAKTLPDACTSNHLKGNLTTEKASVAKYWLTDLHAKIIDRCLQLFGGYGVMAEYPMKRMYRDDRIERIYAGTNDTMKPGVARGRSTG